MIAIVIKIYAVTLVHEKTFRDLGSGFLMNKLLKFGYYNISFGIVIWLILFLYKINIWLAFIGSIIVIYLFVTITSKVLIFINNL